MACILHAGTLILIATQKLIFWFIINDVPLEIMDYDLKTRNKIRKGLKECQVKKIKKDELIKKGYDVYYFCI